MAHWYVEMIAPLTHFGDASAWYNGTTADMIPIDTPVMNLPMHSTNIVYADTWQMLPIINTKKFEKMMAIFLPNVSLSNGAESAPKNVPKDKIAVRILCSLAVKFSWFAAN
jgi:hypothetical protein